MCPAPDIVRRYWGGRINFERAYAGLADACSVFDDSVAPIRILRSQPTRSCLGFDNSAREPRFESDR
jgi:hypothetical protein